MIGSLIVRIFDLRKTSTGSHELGDRQPWSHPEYSLSISYTASRPKTSPTRVSLAIYPSCHDVWAVLREMSVELRRACAP